MVALTQKMKDMLAQQRIIPIATSTKDGKPNVVPMGFVKPLDDETILLVDNYLKKTAENLRNNPQVALTFWATNPPCGYQLKGPVSIYTEGKYYDQMKDIVKATGKPYPAKAAIIMHIEEIYECTPGADAGKRIA